ncbi:MAG: flavoprotein [Pseudomonadota bacterium]|nr:flavoprotein [Pseudomonadota bacterium]
MRILLGVTGGIAAYKSCELTSLAIKAGHEVRVVMTANATRFVGPVTFEALSGNPVLLDTFVGAPLPGSTSAIDHISWARWPEAVIVAPLSANTLAKLACGLADDALSTVLMAVPSAVPVVLAPAMNTAMWEHPVVRRNLGWLRDLERYVLVEPISKRLACGDVGPGGLPDPADLLGLVTGATAPSAPVAVSGVRS